MLGTIFFDSIGRGDFHHALTVALVVEVALMIALLVVSPLLPRYAREPAPDAVG